MSFTRTKYDSCDTNWRCNVPAGTGEYMLNKMYWENTNVCSNNQSVDLSYFNNSIGDRTDIESELRSMNQELGNCSVNKQELCLGKKDNEKPKIRNIKPAVVNICDRSIQCGKLSNPGQNDCFGLNAGLNCKK